MFDIIEIQNNFFFDHNLFISSPNQQINAFHTLHDRDGGTLAKIKNDTPIFAKETFLSK